METPAMNSMLKRSLGETANKSSKPKKAKLKAPLFSAPTEMVTFLVGKDAEPFSVHKEFACHYSPVLRAAFDSEFIEGQTKTYRLDEIEPAAFRLFVKYLYSERVETHLEEDADKGDANEGNGDDAKTDEDDRSRDLQFAQLWVLGDRLLMPRLQNEVMRAWNKVWTEPNIWCSSSWLTYAYEHTLPDSPLRHLAVDQFTFVLSPVDILAHPEEFPREMLLEMAITCNRAIIPTAAPDERLNEKLDQGPLMQKDKPGYRCTRTWRSYLVPEDV